MGDWQKSELKKRLSQEKVIRKEYIHIYEIAKEKKQQLYADTLLKKNTDRLEASFGLMIFERGNLFWRD